MENLSHYIAIVESSEDAIISIRLDGTITIWNAGATTLFGYTAEEICGRSILTIVPAALYDEVASLMSSVRRGEHVAPFETERVGKDGNVVHISMAISPVRDAAGTIVGGAAIVRDISARIQDEQALALLSGAVEQTDDSVIITDQDGTIQYVNAGFERLTGYSRAEALGQTPRLIKSGQHAVAYYTDLWRTILSGQPFRTELVNRKKNGELYFEEKTITPIRDKQGKITHFVSTGKDITERILAYQTLERQVEERTSQVAQLYKQAEQRSQELEALYRADEQLHRHLRLDRVLQALVDVVVDLLHADKARVQVWDEDRRVLAVRAARGYTSDVLALLSTYAPGDEIAERVFLTGKPLAVEDVQSARPSTNLVTEREGIHAILCIPIMIDRRVFGVFGVDYCKPRTFSPADRRLFSALADRAALAIENARLYEQAEQAATLEERQRLARDLHDSVTQSLYSLTLLAEAGKRSASAGDLMQVEHNAERLAETARQSLKDMRLMVYELTSPELRKTGLVGAIQHRLQAVEHRAGIQTRLDVQGRPNVPEPVEQELYHIAIEALNNALKHASATCTTVDVRASGEFLEMEISDDGKGFELPSGGGGMGLRNMRERTKRLGGEFVVRSSPGQGTTILVRVPIPIDLRAGLSRRESVR